MLNSKTILIAAGAAGMMLAESAAPSPALAKDYYAGKMITVLIAASAGGGLT